LLDFESLWPAVCTEATARGWMASNEAKLRVIIGVVTHRVGNMFTAWSEPAHPSFAAFL
jgi:hypothetical protein